MRSRKKRILAITLAGVVALLVVVRLVLPGLIKGQLNKKLSQLDGYVGQVEDVSLHLLRGRAELNGVAVVISATKVPVPLFWTDSVDLKIEWKPLLHRKVVAAVRVVNPRINFVQGAVPQGPKTDYAALLREAAPFEIDAFRIDNGEVHYRDYSSSPAIDVSLTDIDAVAMNLTNRPAAGDELPAEVQLKAKVLGEGKLALNLKADPLKESPTFQLKQSLNNVDLTKLNDFFNAYAKVKVKKGTFGMYAEAAGKDGKFIGYAEPHFKDMVLDKAYKNPVKTVWAVVASSVKWLFSNKKTKQVATRIPIKGTFDKTEVGYLPAVGGILKNAYIKALTPATGKAEHVSPADAEKVKPKKK